MEHFDALEAILHELGLTRREFETSERKRLELSPATWMQERLAKLGWAPVGVIAKLSKDAA